ncbi:MAG: hypothetical protein M3Y54_02000 [Bacteroidota bacterium]|nr:hypothetical protein [Bacteroidota bacterium]
MFTTPGTHLTTLADKYGERLVDLYYVEADALLFLRWHGHVTADEIVRAITEGGQWRTRYTYQRILNDKRAASGEWSEALPWIQYEWTPRAVARGIRAMADIVSLQIGDRPVTEAFAQAVRDQLPVAVFTNEAEALRWIRSQ